MGILSRVAGIAGGLGVVADHPFTASAVVAAVTIMGSYGSSQQIMQQVRSDPTTSTQQRPGASSSYNLGGDGQLVLALHRSR